MRVTHIITRLVVGGAQENTVATVLGLQRKSDLRVDLISGPTTGPEGSMESVSRLIPGSSPSSLPWSGLCILSWIGAPRDT